MSLEEAIKGIKSMLEQNEWYLTEYERKLLTKVLKVLQTVYTIATEE